MNKTDSYSKILYNLYKIHKLRSVVIKLLNKLEKGQFYSETLRVIFEDFHEIEVGKYSYGCFEPVNIRPMTKIGRYCSIGKGVKIFNANHPIRHKSLHPFFYDPVFNIVKKEILNRRWVTIGNDVWIGANAIITPSVESIGDGAIIGTGAIVTKDVPNFAIVAGNPAKIIKYRFDDKTIKTLLAEKWWKKNIEDIGNINEFTKPYELK